MKKLLKPILISIVMISSIAHGETMAKEQPTAHGDDPEGSFFNWAKKVPVVIYKTSTGQVTKKDIKGTLKPKPDCGKNWCEMVKFCIHEKAKKSSSGGTDLSAGIMNSVSRGARTSVHRIECADSDYELNCQPPVLHPMDINTHCQVHGVLIW